MLDPFVIEILELNTQADPRPGWRDESPGQRCRACGHVYRLGWGMDEDPKVAAVTRKHMELCEGDAAVTLMKIEQAYKAGWRP